MGSDVLDDPTVEPSDLRAEQDVDTGADDASADPAPADADADTLPAADITPEPGDVPAGDVDEAQDAVASDASDTAEPHDAAVPDDAFDALDVAASAAALVFAGTPLGDWPDAWVFPYAYRDRLGFGVSSAFADDSEGQLHVVIAAASDGLDNLCRYGVEGHDWVADPAACATGTANVNTVAWIPPHAGLNGRFVLGGNGRLVLVEGSFAEQADLFGPDASPDDRRCAAFAIHPVDVDLDGLLDVVVGCHGPAATVDTLLQTLVFRALPGGSFARMDERDAGAFRRSAVLLSLPGADLNDDGLLDYVYVADTFSNPDRRNTLNTPTTVFFRCTPTDDCAWRPVPIDGGRDAWGSHMGAGLVRVDSFGPLVGLSDWGARDLRDVGSEPLRDVAAAAGFDGGRDEATSEFLYSWSMAVADFDRNGLRDVLVTQATAQLRRLERSSVPAHPDLLLLQRGGGTFETRTESAWLTAADGVPVAPETTRYHRGAIVQDFDLDGLIDVYVNQYGRAPVILEELPTELPPRCLLRFHPRVVPTAGAGLQTGPTPHGPWDAAVFQGEMRLQAPLRAVVDDREGYVRFPSGAIVAYACGDDVGPHEVLEPDWLRVAREGDAVRVTLDPAAWPDPVAAIDVLLVDGSRSRVGFPAVGSDGLAPLPGPAVASAAMLRINGRWVGRYFELPTPSDPD